MNFKTSKNQVVDNATHRAEYIMRRMTEEMRHNRYDPYGGGGSAYGNLGRMEHMVVLAIREAIMSVVDDIYTDEEFEQDLGLTDKS